MTNDEAATVDQSNQRPLHLTPCRQPPSTAAGSYEGRPNVQPIGRPYSTPQQPRVQPRNSFLLELALYVEDLAFTPPPQDHILVVLQLVRPDRTDYPADPRTRANAFFSPAIVAPAGRLRTW